MQNNDRTIELYKTTPTYSNTKIIHQIRSGNSGVQRCNLWRIVKAEPYAMCRKKTPLGLRAKHLSRSRVQPLPS